MVTDLVNDIVSGTYDTIPPRTRRDGGKGGGRTSDFLDAIREKLSDENSFVAIPVQRGNRRRRVQNPDGSRGGYELVLDDQGNPVRETFQEAAERITSRLYRKNALNFPITTRKDEAEGVIRVFRLAQSNAENAE